MRVHDHALELARRDRLLRGLAEAMRALLELRAGERAGMRRVLGHLGEGASVDRTYVFENSFDPTTGARLMSQRFEWVAGGVESYLEDPKLQDLPYALFAGWEEALSQRRPVHQLARVLSGSTREIMDEEGIKTLLLVPIFAGDAFWGFVGFDNCKDEREWADPEVDALRAFAETLGAVLERQRIEAALAVTSTPAVQLWERTLLLALHGDLSAATLAQIAGGLLTTVHARAVRHVLLDVTAVSRLDVELALPLQRLIDAVGLIGARCVLVGLSPHAAQTLATLPTGLRGAQIRATLQDGLALTFAEQGLEVVRRRGPA